MMQLMDIPKKDSPHGFTLPTQKIKHIFAIGDVEHVIAWCVLMAACTLHSKCFIGST